MSETLPQTIILIHGLRGEHHGLSAIAKNLRPTYRTLVPDLPGSGDRLELDNKTLDGYADCYITTLNRKIYQRNPSLRGILWAQLWFHIL